MLWLLVSFSVLCVYGISEADHAALTVAREKWSSVAGLDYTYEYHQGPCFCTEIAFEPKLVTVKNGVVSVILLSTGEPFDYSPGSIPTLFDQIEALITENKKIEVTYNDTFGFPQGDIKLDIDAMAYDGGTWWVISNFHFLASCDSLTNCFTCTTASCFWQEGICGKDCGLQDTSCADSLALCEPLFCDASVQECSDGTFVSRNPLNDCKYDECPSTGEPVFCTMDAKICDDGSSVGRDPTRGCAFELCPEEVYPWISYHQGEIEEALGSIIGFVSVRIVEAHENDDLTLRVVLDSSDRVESLLDSLKDGFANFIGVRSSRVVVSHFSADGVKRQSAWLVTLEVDEYSGATVVSYSVLTFSLVVGWLWI